MKTRMCGVVRMCLSAICLLTAFVQMGCRHSYDPPFKESDLLFDARLVGLWSSTIDQSTSYVLISEAKQSTQEGRLKPRSGSWDGSSSDQREAQELGPTRPTETSVYEILISSENSDDQHVLEFRGYPIRATDSLILCLQEELRREKSKDSPSLFEYPVHIHRFFKLELRGDTLRVWTPEHPVGLITGVRPIDSRSVSASAACDEVENALAGSTKDRRLMVTADPDRAAGLYRHYAEMPGFWASDLMVFIRVKDPPEGVRLTKPATQDSRRLNGE